MRPEGTVPEGMLNYYDLLASGREQEPDVDIREGDLVGLAQTGGTTGRPKGRFSATAL
jgi:long-subunit acyl-CoA synthetase (AMP-forming)